MQLSHVVHTSHLTATRTLPAESLLFMIDGRRTPHKVPLVFSISPRRVRQVKACGVIDDRTYHTARRTNEQRYAQISGISLFIIL